jgi:hypothetical protein
MIQRIQSVYLSLITLISLLYLKGGILIFAEKAGSLIKVTFGGLIRVSSGQGPEMIEKLIPLSVIIILIPLISLITIFLFKNRKIQLYLALVLIVLASVFLIALVHVSMSVISKFDANIVPGFMMIIPFLILIHTILAYRGIKRDDKLVKSYDRLR